ncbi:MAG: hypothetical protein V7609_2083 [Verrucomicrobiota bacterium]
MELHKVPGYTRTRERAFKVEESYREYSYLDLSDKICGIAVGPLTFQVYLQLCRIESPFLCGGRPPFIHDVAFFLFRLSPAYDQAREAKRAAMKPQPRWRRLTFSFSAFPYFSICSSSPEERGAVAFIEVRRKFIERVRGLNFQKAVRGINRFVDRMLLDKPISSKRKNLSFDPADVSVAGDIIHLIAGAYGWKRDEILQLPMPEVFQALRKIQRDMPGCPKRAHAKVHPIAARLTRKHVTAALAPTACN